MVLFLCINSHPITIKYEDIWEIYIRIYKKRTNYSLSLYIFSEKKTSSSNLLVFLLSAANRIPSLAKIPKHVPAWLIASIAYSTWYKRPTKGQKRNNYSYMATGPKFEITIWHKNKTYKAFNELPFIHCINPRLTEYTFLKCIPI